jgi:hypothetical protein
MDRSHKKCLRLNDGRSLSKKEISFIPPPSVFLESGIFSFYHKAADKKRGTPVFFLLDRRGRTVYIEKNGRSKSASLSMHLPHIHPSGGVP